MNCLDKFCDSPVRKPGYCAKCLKRREKAAKANKSIVLVRNVRGKSQSWQDANRILKRGDL